MKGILPRSLHSWMGDEQDAIVNILSMLDGRVMAAEEELNKMRNLKSGLLQQLFV